MANKYPLVLTGTTVEEIQSTDVIPVDAGGTGATTLTANNVLLGNGTSALQVVAPGATGNVLTSNGSTWVSSSATFDVIATTDSATPFLTTLGYEAGANNTGISNTFAGYQAGKANTTGTRSVCVGYQAGTAKTTGGYGVIIGASAAPSLTTATYAVAIGYQALYSVTTAGFNVAIGAWSASYTTTGTGNTAVGYQSLQANTTGYHNNAIGYAALGGNTTGNNNTAIGAFAGVGMGGGGDANTTGSNNIFIGYGTAGPTPTTSNTITLGNSSIATLRCQVTTITALSDARDKTDIAELDAGLDFINALAPVSFTWNMRDGGKVGEPDTGFIAQELVKAQEDTGHYIPGLVYDENPERLEAGYGKLIPVLVKAIQELSAEVSALKSQLKSQLNEVNNG